MKRILLVDPLPNDFRQGGKKMYPSGALVLIGTMCQEQGYGVKIVDMVAENISVSKLKRLALSFKPDIVGITVNTFQTKNAKQVAKVIKETNKSILVVIGGPHPSALKLNIFDDFDNVDISVVGEGEFAFIEIAEGKKLEDIKGICYANKMNESRHLVENLDYVPLPNLDLVDLNKYVGANYETDQSMFIMASRGCPSQCTFCNKSVFGHKVRYRKPSKIIDEIRWLHKNYGVSEVFFTDDTFNLNRKWIENILNLIIANGLDDEISYIAPFRANAKLVDKKLLDLAKKANFQWVFYGVESGNQGMLNRMKKNITTKEIERTINLTHTAGIKTRTSFILGLPGETKGTINDTIAFFKKLKPTDADIAVATPFPSTQFEKDLKKQGYLLTQNYDEYKYGGNYIRTDELSNEELGFLSFVLSYGFHHRRVLFLPLCEMASFSFFRLGLQITRKVLGVVRRIYGTENNIKYEIRGDKK